jgi:hypothetical protein
MLVRDFKLEPELGRKRSNASNEEDDDDGVPKPKRK